MDVLYPRCAGLDVHKDSVVAAVRLVEPGGLRSEGRRVDTTTPGLLALSAWLADLLAHGLVRAVERMRSTVPDAPTQAMRALLRTRKQLVREQSAHVPRRQKTLEDANLKLASVLTDIMGLSGRTILEALVAGETDPGRLLALVHPRVKAAPARLRAALTGRPTDRHRLLLRLHLGQYDTPAKAP